MANNNHYILEVEKVSKIFKNNSGIKNISFKIKRGAFHTIIGSNGAGKTTFIRTLLGLYQKYSGSIKIDGISTKDPSAFKGISYISELPVFPSEFSAEKFLLWSGKLSSIDENEVKAKMEQFSKDLKIEYLLKKNPNKFSSGEKQKIMLVKILIENPKILIMDEPTANLDPAARIMFFNQIKKMYNEGKTIIISTHNLDEVEEKVTSLTVFRKGQIVYDATKKSEKLIEIFHKYYKDEEVKNN